MSLWDVNILNNSTSFTGKLITSDDLYRAIMLTILYTQLTTQLIVLGYSSFYRAMQCINAAYAAGPD